MTRRPKIVPGCHYKTTWQTNSIEFVLIKLCFDGEEVVLRPVFKGGKRWGKEFKTSVKSIIFVDTEKNRNREKKIKAKKKRYEFKEPS